ncbi:DUF3667 domain-containing protein [Solirubrum puertoriconensis]|uniref:DUF3667 domain-containing protein n=1 Tax=Solirubrum puertoriconensis TaxID=1751427 RepID=A0A9X0HHT7_SOLP1|nr:DUF3667 domain-containing protein [Solirubrum puertoriconensis]KUG06153.1 hypothetical protein ASU33_01945 [Solirubrum puertoriconensis]
MAHTPHRSPACANCGYDFVAAGGPNSFCPNCGQENHDLNLSFGHLVEETLEGLFHFDSKFFRTLGLLLFRPGRLTRLFNLGHRVAYVPPIRLYVFTSFIFFLLVGLLMGHDERRLVDTTTQASQAANAALDSTRAAVIQARPGLDPNILARVPNNIDSIEVGRVRFGTAELERYARNPSPERTDSLIRSKGVEPTFLNRLALRQWARVRESTVDQVRQRLTKNASISMFVLMPLFALLLKGVYVRRKRLYINHLVFSLHLHCFLFVLVLAGMLWTEFVKNDWFDWVLTLAPPVYLVLALRHVYEQGWPKTFAKALVVSVAYLLIIGFVMTSVLLLSLALL